MRGFILFCVVVLVLVSFRIEALTLTAENVPVKANFVDNGDGTGEFAFMPDTTQAGWYDVLFIAQEGLKADSGILSITVEDLVQSEDSIVVILDSLLSQNIVEGETLHVIITARIETVYIDTTEPEPDTGQVFSIEATCMQSADDGQESEGSGYVNTSHKYLEVMTELNRWGVAVRFPDLDIPQDANILDAKISVMNYVSTFKNISVEVALEDVDSATTLGGYYDISSRWERRTSSISWIGVLNTNPGERTYSPDFSVALQEVVNRPGWKPGNAVIFLWKCVNSKAEIFSQDAVDWDGEHSYGAILYVKYQSR